jgi:Tfp pilus assembly protein PilF
VKAATHLLLAQQFLDAKSRADKVLARDPQNTDAIIVRANATAGLKDLPGAIKDMEDALKASAADGRMLTSLGFSPDVEGGPRRGRGHLQAGRFK